MMIVGPTGAGKTSNQRCLAHACGKLKAMGEDTDGSYYEKTVIHVLYHP